LENNKLEKELDCSEILQSIRQLKVLMNSIFDENQQTLARFHKEHVLNESAIMSDEETVNNSRKRKRPLLIHQNTSLHHQNVDNLMRRYSIDRLDQKELNLIEGVVLKNHNNQKKINLNDIKFQNISEEEKRNYSNKSFSEASSKESAQYK
jgi:hypothetical protein